MYDGKKVRAHTCIHADIHVSFITYIAYITYTHTHIHRRTYTHTSETVFWG